MHSSEFEHSESSAREIARTCTKKILDAVSLAAKEDPAYQRIIGLAQDAEILNGLMQMAEAAQPQKRKSPVDTFLHKKTGNFPFSLQTQLTDFGYISVFLQSKMLLPELPTQSWLFDAVLNAVIESGGHELSAASIAEFVRAFIETSYVAAVQLEVQFSQTEKLRLCFVSSLSQWLNNRVLIPNLFEQSRELFEVTDETSAASVKEAVLQQITDYTKSQRLWLTRAR
ncbi:hypothetical protein KA078_00840 [Candidatus Woesebacteria bacterium]|nr:hypothetical protein [Candidatus Woesebacteria bacterium]